MSERKDGATGELEDEQLSNVTGGVGVESPAQPPGATDSGGPDLAPSAIISPRDSASGLPSGKRMHKPFVITKDPDPTMS